MEISKLSKKISKYLPLLVAVVVAVTGVFIAKDVRQTSFDSQMSIEQINPELSASFESTGSCALPYIYTSLPAKCKTLDGKFIPIDGMPSNLVGLPELK